MQAGVCLLPMVENSLLTHKLRQSEGPVAAATTAFVSCSYGKEHEALAF